MLDVHPEADAETDAAYEWYATQSLDAAEDFLDAVRHAFRQIEEIPGVWPRHLYDTRKLLLLPKFPYLIVYREVLAGVLVIAVAHGKPKRLSVSKRR